MGLALGVIYPKGVERFFPHFSFKVGDGSTIFFWHDRWCGEVPLKELFSGLYVLAMDKYASIVDSSICSVVMFGRLFLSKMALLMMML